MKNKKTILLIALIIMVVIPAYTQQYDDESDFEVKREGKSLSDILCK
jgi:hypothetical protein